jgi:membrane associated rhomboid family serine protease
VGTFSRGYGYQFNIGDYFPRAIKTICIACVSVFVAQELSRLIYHDDGWNFWLQWFGLVPYAVTHFPFRIWQPFTYLFLHGTIGHIFFNLLYLAMFGADLERTWGSRKFYRYYFVCGVGAGLIDMAVREILANAHLASGHVLIDSTIGASGAIYGVLLAVAMVMPHRRVWFFPLPLTMPMWLLVTILGALEFFLTIGASGDGISHVCHLGGMLVGYLYLRRGSYLYTPRNFFSDWKRRRLRKKFEVYARDHRDKPPSQPNDWLN